MKTETETFVFVITRRIAEFVIVKGFLVDVHPRYDSFKVGLAKRGSKEQKTRRGDRFVIERRQKIC
jgi:hypothetical protein